MSDYRDFDDDREQALHNRLVAWWVSGESLPEIWADACGRFQDALSNPSDAADADPFLTPKDTLISSFERALDGYDGVLRLVGPGGQEGEREE